MNPADELRTAADKIRTLATAASTDPHGRPTTHWSVRYRPGVHPDAPAERDQPCALIATDGPTEVRLLLGGAIGNRGGSRAAIYPDHGRYAAAMDPAVGLALADWLDQAARHYDAGVQAADDVFRDPAGREAFLTTGPGAPSEQALAVARAINGTAP
ncbi:hypothetical protein [Streptomyces anthocyanicus]|uniref:hypothetical protein n=1 Tax=Streptomyces anthocyanicus TaxID=68174 RepID=UPI00386E3848|nr:hypothetical protein OH747_05600 [Streptomyces anthocyanicus]